MFMDEVSFTTLSNEPSFYNQTVELIGSAFEYDNPRQFAVDFATLMDRKNLQHNHILVTEDRVVGHIGVRIRKLGNTPVALVGGIAVAPDHRKRGYLYKLMERVSLAYNKKAAFFMLWSDQQELYQRFGYEMVGVQYETNGAGTKSDEYKPFSGDDLQPDDREQMKELYKKMYADNLTFERTEYDWATFSQITTPKYYIRKLGNQILGYYICGKGEDLKNIVHEYAHESCKARDIIDGVRKGQRIWLAENHCSADLETIPQYLGLIKITNTDFFTEFLKDWSGGKLILKEWEEDKCQFIFENTLYRDKCKHFLKLVFGPSRASEFEEFPHLFVSGLDSL